MSAPMRPTSSLAATWSDDANVEGTLHIYVAFDVEGEIDLDRARVIAPAQQQSLPRRPRTPSSITYRPAPLHYRLDEVSLTLKELGAVAASAEATVFDFGAVSVALRVPFRVAPSALVRVARELAEPAALVAAARTCFAPWYDKLLAAIAQPDWSDLTEEYFVFELPYESSLPAAGDLLSHHSAWLASLVRLEDEPLSHEEVEEALRMRIAYGMRDLFIPEWSAAVLIDQSCGETLQTIEFANLQLLEFRYLDQRLDQRLSETYRLIHPLARSWLPFWRTHSLPLRALGELRMEANDVFERTGNALKLVGDQYLARVYRLMAARLHLDAWEQSIERALHTVEGVHRILADQAGMFRAEFLEIIIIVLIALEIVMSIFGK